MDRGYDFLTGLLLVLGLVVLVLLLGLVLGVVLDKFVWRK